MIRRLRVKFVCINMTIVTIMLCVIFALVLYFTHVNMERESIEMMQEVAMQSHKPWIPGDRTPGAQLSHFTLQQGAGGEWIVYGSGNYDLTDTALLNELIARTGTQQSGVLKEYDLRFMRVTTPSVQRIVFADMSREIGIIQDLLKSCMVIGISSFVIFLLLSILLAHWAVRPVEVAWEQQRQFVADASHELKTPLTVILSNAQMLSGNGEDPQLRQRLTGNLVTVAEQMKDLVARLLDCARVDQGIAAAQLVSLDWSGTVTRALLPFDSLFYELELELESQIEPDIQVRGSQTHLIQVVDILLDNARKYSAPHGRTMVTLRRHGKRSCLLTVSNPGQPIESRELKSIFKRFYRTDAARERTGSYGLGLSIAQGIVEAHRGKIWAESGQGVNTFCVLLPLFGEKGH